MARLKGKNEEITGNLDSKYWVQKADPLVLMRSVPFSLGELKILDTYISRINATDDKRRTVIFTKEEYEELLGITYANYRSLEKNTDGLLGKVVTLKMPNNEFFKFVLFSKAHYYKDEYGKPIIELTCTEEAKDLFFCIGKYHYFKYALENVIKLTRKSSYLLYIYIHHNRYRGEWEILLNELRDTVLDCKEQESYQEYKVFKRDVLDPAVKEINQKTDCHFEYQPIRRSRRIAKIKFIYHSQANDELSDDQTDVPKLLTNNEDELYDLKTEEYGSENLAILGSACDYAFDKYQMQQILSVLQRNSSIPRDMMTNSLAWGRHSYLLGKYAALRSAENKKSKKGERPIKDRFKYFLKMLEEDTDSDY